MARFFVLGNCQVDGLTKFLRVLHPTGYVETGHLWNLRRDFENEDRLLAYLHTFDFVVLQDFGNDVLGTLDSDAVRAAIPGALTIPVILFSAFHPDLVYALSTAPGTPGNRVIRSAIGDYQSALVVYGYLQGLTIEQTIALFRPEVYRALGYTNMWSESESFLLDSFRRFGWAPEDSYMRWVRQGVFMHTINHPKLCVIADIARMILKRCDIEYNDDPMEDRTVDPLMASPIWPVYPAIAEMYGLRGSMNFKRDELDQKVQLFLALPEFVYQTMTVLEMVPREHVDCARARQWIASGALSAFTI
jgi:Polysaccharide biosynthesis enzyme WcbI